MPDGSLSSEEERWCGEEGDGNNWMRCNDGGRGGGEGGGGGRVRMMHHLKEGHLETWVPPSDQLTRGGDKANNWMG